MKSKDSQPSSIWITWQVHTRTRSICNELGIELHELISSKTRFLRYVILSYKTIRLIRKTSRSTVLLVQSPSILLALLATAVSRAQNRTCIIDCHNGGIKPLEGKYTALNYVAQLSIRLSSKVIVTNQALAREVNKIGGESIVLPDPLPRYAHLDRSQPSTDEYMVFICTWATDEPFLELIEAAKQVTTKIFITGNHKNRFKNNLTLEESQNIVLTGFLGESEFEKLLLGAKAIIDLTTREDCLVCGAYESTSLEKPMILSNTRALKKHFHSGAVYTDNSVEDIAKAIKYADAKNAELKAGIKKLRKDLTDNWNRKSEELRRLIS